MTAEEFRAELVSALAIVFGKAGGEARVAGFESLVRKRAEEGAARAVKRGLYVSAAIFLGPPLLGALWRWRTSRKKAAE